MRFGSCPEFISDCYDHSVERSTALENQMSILQLEENRSIQRGSNASTDNTYYSHSSLIEDKTMYTRVKDSCADLVFTPDEEDFVDQFSQQEKIQYSEQEVQPVKPFIGAGHYSGFSGEVIYDYHNTEEEQHKDHTDTQLMDQMVNTLNTLHISNSVYNQILQNDRDIEDLKFLLQYWCLEGPFSPEMPLECPSGHRVSINSTVNCTLDQWNYAASHMKVELLMDPEKRLLVENSPMKRYYGDLYPNNGRDKSYRGHLFA